MQSNAPNVPALESGFSLSPQRATATKSPSPSPISSCSTISQPGSYALTKNLKAPSGQICITIENTSKTTLNCQKHSVTSTVAVLVSNMNGYTVENCSLQPESAGFVFEVDNSSNGTITDNTVGHTSSTPQPIVAPISISHSTGLTVQANTFYQQFQESFSTGSVISKNTFGCPLSNCGAMIVSVDGSLNQMLSNKMNGDAGTDAPEWSPGADDGIDPEDESSDLIEGNTIENVWDCGIETYGVVTSTTISNNTISNAATCGVGGWYFMSLSNSTISGNAVSGSSNLLQFFRSQGLRPAGFAAPNWPADTGVYFTGNTFSGNTFTKPYSNGNGSGNGYSSFIPFTSNNGLPYYLNYDPGNVGSGNTNPAPSQFHLSNNTFTNNNFGAKNPPVFFGEPALAGAVIDGGGNICAPTTYADYPLACGRPH